jgi:hypothetical protein
MDDIQYLLLTAVLAALTAGLAWICARLMERRP